MLLEILFLITDFITLLIINFHLSFMKNLSTIKYKFLNDLQFYFANRDNKLQNTSKVVDKN